MYAWSLSKKQADEQTEPNTHILASRMDVSTFQGKCDKYPKSYLEVVQ